MQIISEVADGLEAVQKVELLEPDLVLLDIGLPTLNGIGPLARFANLPRLQNNLCKPESSSEGGASPPNWGVGLRCKSKGRKRPSICCGRVFRVDSLSALDWRFRP